MYILPLKALEFCVSTCVLFTGLGFVGFLAFSYHLPETLMYFGFWIVMRFGFVLPSISQHV